MSINKVILVGNLGADPELKYTKSGVPFVNMRLATNEHYRDKEGATKTATEWHNVVVFGPQAVNHAKFLTKGKQAYIEGKNHTRMWVDQQGNKHYRTEVIGLRVAYLGTRPQEEVPPPELPEDLSDDQIPV